MKKIIAVICLIGMMLWLFAACNNSGGVKQYTCQELTMQIPEKSEDVSSRKEYQEQAFAINSNDLAIAGQKKSKDDFTREEEMTAKDYIHAFQIMNAHKGTVTERNEYYYYISHLGGTHIGTTVTVGVYENGNDIWCIQLISDPNSLSDGELLEYLDSVTFS